MHHENSLRHQLQQIQQGKPVFCQLNQYGLLRVSGEDATTFLQNLLSNDIRQVSPQQAQLSSFNTAKGRMLADMLIWQDQQDYILQLSQALCEPIRKKLSMYVLRAKVKISDISTEFISLGVVGTLLPTLYEALPSTTWTTVSIDQGNIICLDPQRWQINVPASMLDSVSSQLQQQHQMVDAQCWDWLEVQAGIPHILPQTQEQFVPQMINFEHLGGINFKKGCYPGQEIVARMQYLGKAKKRMFLAHIESDTPPTAGDELFSAELNGQSCGMVVNTAPAPQGGYDLLACIQISSQAEQAIHWRSLEGPTLSTKTLL